MATACSERTRNLERCNCSSNGCPKKGQCCECLHSHLAKQQLPGCCFPDAAEATFDRSFRKFIEVWKDRV